MDENINEETPVYDLYVTETPSVKDQIVSASIGAGVGLVLTGIVYGGCALVFKGMVKYQERKDRRLQKKIAEELHQKEIEEQE